MRNYLWLMLLALLVGCLALTNAKPTFTFGFNYPQQGYYHGNYYGPRPEYSSYHIGFGGPYNYPYSYSYGNHYGSLSLAPFLL